MDKFELDDRKLKRDLIELGIGKEKADEMFQMIKNSYGLDNDFPKLSDEDTKRVKNLSNRRTALINEYKRLAWILEPLLEEESKVWDELDGISEQICEIQGHRLSSDAIPLIDYNHVLELSSYARSCVICGTVFKKDEMLDNDVVVTDKISYPKRIRYKK